MEQQQLFKVRDLRKKDQYKIDDKYLNGYAKIFGPTTTAVYNSLSRHAEFHTQEAFPSEELIAEEHGIGRKSVQRSIKQLKGANIIKVDRVRRKGKWLNNMYYLVDRDEWFKPEDIKDLWKAKRHWRRKPEDIKAKTIGHQDPIKDTHSKDNTYKELATLQVADPINPLIELFKSVNPTYTRLYSDKTQRACLDRLLRLMGREKLEAVINIIQQTNQMPYAPVITTPYELEKKLGSLMAFVKKEQIKIIKRKPSVAIIK
uniref:Putative DNA binding, helix-turn-helix domain containing protein n=1 Tax=viral metagenome TaxID=1070528 RepID=A0A6H1ZFV1_9ZZZZ